MSTLKIALPLLAVLLGIAVVTTATEAVAAEGPYSTPVIRAAFGCQFSDGQLICGTLKKHGHAQPGSNEGDGRQGEPPCRRGGAAGLTRFGMPCDVQKNKKKKKDVDVGSEGECSCPPGYVVLKEKNKYGAFCEPKEGFPEQADQGGAGPTPAAVQKVCCNGHAGGGNGPIICSRDSTPPETEAEIRHTLESLFPNDTTTCVPE
ncbi:hypothetical protein [Mesorhizobium captivum]|uniref:hypothetical protein n=1 Tax=Mesorhizobium captivum TaxID=3072319 RepID=UPI002A247882|nr:hypothetical protein [Mesorhizobium sp. VK22E]MDX8509773.1 hypothetical protein [Mesorhizobium sp. VK22E]